jgi:hypothetical protein
MSLGFITCSSTEMTGLQFDNHYVKTTSEMVEIYPKFEGVNFSFGFTICLRAKFDFWEETTIFYSDQFYLNLNDFKDPGVLIGTRDNFYGFKWPGQNISFYNSWNSFCVTIDQEKGNALN